MLLIVIVALALGTILFRRNTLLAGTTEAIEPANKIVKATVDGKLVHSYVMVDNDER